VSPDDWLTLDGIAFPVTDAFFQTNGRELFLMIECGPSADLPEEHDWSYLSPKFYADSAPIAVDADVDSSEIATDSGWLGDEPLLALYLHEHEEVTRCRGRLRRHANEHQLELEGEAEVMGVSFPFVLATALRREPWPYDEPRFLR
jgi:hypothetical protein